jgi:hypothetical protein
MLSFYEERPIQVLLGRLESEFGSRPVISRKSRHGRSEKTVF